MAQDATSAQLHQQDEEWMATARRHARAAGDVVPLPAVGCVLVGADGTEIASGATEPPGGPHAEAAALAAAGTRARGATLYTTLEPCAHQGRTAPCADAIIAAGVARVVSAIEDPDPRVAGAGHQRLRAAGVEVTVGPGAAGVNEDLEAYLHHRRTGRPFCVVKTAMSLDARVAAADGTSQWITGVEARADAHRLRAGSQAIVVGAETAIVDQPSLTVRGADPAPRTPPTRVLLDSTGRVPAVGPLFDSELAPTAVFTTAGASVDAVAAWTGAGAKVETVRSGPHGRGVDLLDVLGRLGADGVLQVLVEGGPTLHASFLSAGLADRIVTYVAPLVLGVEGRPAFAIDGPATLADTPRWRVVHTASVGVDTRIDYEPVGPLGGVH